MPVQTDAPTYMLVATPVAETVVLSALPAPPAFAVHGTPVEVESPARAAAAQPEAP